jgi:hypothetical protein
MIVPGTVLVAALLAEIPLPDSTLYGHLTTRAGAPVTSGLLRARVRGPGGVRESTGSFREAEGESWYVIDVALETSIGAPGPSGVGAHEGDVLEALTLNGQTLILLGPAPTMAAGAAFRLDATGAAGGSVFFRGDCTPDLRIDISDPVQVLGFLFTGGSTPSCLDACDGDGSGALDISDAIYILQFLFLGGPEPPDPGPRCGIDATPSTLGCVQTPCAA